jgi:hypothetical protein
VEGGSTYHGLDSPESDFWSVFLWK